MSFSALLLPFSALPHGHSLCLRLSLMGRFNGAKTAQKRERNQKKLADKQRAGSSLKATAAAMTIVCKQCQTPFLGALTSAGGRVPPTSPSPRLCSSRPSLPARPF